MLDQDSLVATMSESPKDERFVIMYDADLRKPACVLLQAAMGGGPASFQTLLRQRQRVACRPHARHETYQWNCGGMGKGRAWVGVGAGH